MIEKVSGEFFTDEIVELDNKHFCNCIFAGTTLRYKATGVPPIFEGCDLEGVADIYFSDAAEKTLSFLQSVHGDDDLKKIMLVHGDP